MPIAWKDCRGKKYLFVDYRGLKTEQDLLGLLEQYAQIVKSSPGKVMALADFTETSLSSNYMNRVKTLGKEVFTVKVHKTAVLGVVGLKKILMQGYLTFTGDKNTRAFTSEAEALNWLAE